MKQDTQQAPKQFRRQILRRTEFTIEPDCRVKDIRELRRLLQDAIELEHFTIPPYLCALYSIEESSNGEAAQILRSVVLEEMLHLLLAANVLNAIGGTPCVNHANFIPRYPAKLPVIDEDFIVNLGPFSKEAVEVFTQIERPSPPKGQPKGTESISDFRTIGQFYEAIEIALCELSKKENIFKYGDPKRQIKSEHYYGAGGTLNPVSDLESALEALAEIVGQGEGVHHTIWDRDGQLGPDVAEVAHFFRFKEILVGQFYREGDGINSHPSGQRFHVAWDKVYPMQLNPKIANYPKGSAVREKALIFNRCYMSVLNEIQAAISGEPGRLLRSVTLMYELKYQAIDLMKVPIANGQRTAGPTFEYCPIG